MERVEQDPVAGLIDLLRLERDMIRNGDFAALSELAGHKEALIVGLGTVPRDDLALLRQMSTDNQRLLSAALNGVRAAQRRLQAVCAAAKGFNAYDRSGQVKQIRRDGSSLERRA